MADDGASNLERLRELREFLEKRKRHVEKQLSSHEQGSTDVNRFFIPRDTKFILRQSDAATSRWVRFHNEKHKVATRDGIWIDLQTNANRRIINMDSRQNAVVSTPPVRCGQDIHRSSSDASITERCSQNAGVDHHVPPKMPEVFRGGKWVPANQEMCAKYLENVTKTSELAVFTLPPSSTVTSQNLQPVNNEPNSFNSSTQSEMLFGAVDQLLTDEPMECEEPTNTAQIIEVDAEHISNDDEVSSDEPTECENVGNQTSGQNRKLVDRTHKNWSNAERERHTELTREAEDIKVKLRAIEAETSEIQAIYSNLGTSEQRGRISEEDHEIENVVDWNSRRDLEVVKEAVEKINQTSRKKIKNKMRVPHNIMRFLKIFPEAHKLIKRLRTLKAQISELENGDSCHQTASCSAQNSSSSSSIKETQNERRTAMSPSQIKQEIIVISDDDDDDDNRQMTANELSTDQFQTKRQGEMLPNIRNIKQELVVISSDEENDGCAPNTNQPSNGENVNRRKLEFVPEADQGPSKKQKVSENNSFINGSHSSEYENSSDVRSLTKPVNAHLLTPEDIAQVRPEPGNFRIRILKPEEIRPVRQEIPGVSDFHTFRREVSGPNSKTSTPHPRTSSFDRSSVPITSGSISKSKRSHIDDFFEVISRNTQPVTSKNTDFNKVSSSLDPRILRPIKIKAPFFDDSSEGNGSGSKKASSSQDPEHLTVPVAMQMESTSSQSRNETPSSDSALQVQDARDEIVPVTEARLVGNSPSYSLRSEPGYSNIHLWSNSDFEIPADVNPAASQQIMAVTTSENHKFLLSVLAEKIVGIEQKVDSNEGWLEVDMRKFQRPRALKCPCFYRDTNMMPYVEVKPCVNCAVGEKNRVIFEKQVRRFMKTNTPFVAMSVEEACSSRNLQDWINTNVRVVGKLGMRGLQELNPSGAPQYLCKHVDHEYFLQSIDEAGGPYHICLNFDNLKEDVRVPLPGTQLQVSAELIVLNSTTGLEVMTPRPGTSGTEPMTSQHGTSGVVAMTSRKGPHPVTSLECEPFLKVMVIRDLDREERSALQNYCRALDLRRPFVPLFLRFDEANIRNDNGDNGSSSDEELDANNPRLV